MVYRLMFTAKEPFRLLPAEQAQLEQLVRSTRGSAGLARRARALLLLAGGSSLRQIQTQTRPEPPPYAALEEALRRNPVGRIAGCPAGRTYASWLNQVEIWLGMITRDCIRRGIFHSVPDLIHQIMNYIRLYNRNAQPFHWTYANPKKRIHVSLSSVTRH